MEYTIAGIRTFDRYPGSTYAHLMNAETGECVISATLEYIIEQILEKGYEVTNYKHVKS